MTPRLKNKNLNAGQISFQILIFGSVAVLFLAGFLVWLDTTTKSILRSFDRQQAIAIAESGIEYYRWHLAHAPQDYTDATSTPGPYVHNYYDKNNNLIGSFSLTITPPPVGSTIVTIQSSGKVLSDPSIEKIIKVRMGVPSFAKYAAVLNDNVRFGQGTEVFGAIHSNSGIRFDGLAHNLITSALSSYDDPDHTGANEFGVHTHVNPPPGSGVNDTFRPLEAPSNPVQTRADVFLAGRNFPVPAVDFTGITQDFAQMRADSLINGFHASSSGVLGYDVVFITNKTFNLFKVTSLVSPSSTCPSVSSQPDWGSWSIKNETLLGNYPMPNNGLIFLEDNVWVSGQINGSRVTVASARFPDNPTTRSSITVNHNLLYTNYDGTDVISLIAQNNINIGMVSDNIIRIDAALMAQNGRVGRYYYQPPDYFSNRCSPYHTRNTITTFGMIGSSQRYGFAYTDSTGYQTRNLNYDSNLMYGPPPSFPLTTDSYQTISWDEAK